MYYVFKCYYPTINVVLFSRKRKLFSTQIAIDNIGQEKCNNDLLFFSSMCLNITSYVIAASVVHAAVEGSIETGSS